ncbi:hypothetical protein ABIF55_005615 [Bradyrhizobium diazoefficiens]
MSSAAASERYSEKRAILGAVGAGERGDLVQVILRLLAVALLELPEAVILPGADVVRIVLQRQLVIDLRRLVVAELAIGIADQIGNVGDVVALERLQLIDRAGVVMIVVDRGVGGAIGSKEFRIADGRALLLALLGRSVRLRRRRGLVAPRGIGAGQHRPGCERHGNEPRQQKH